MTDLGDRYIVGPWASAWAVYDLATDKRTGPTHPTQQAAEQAATQLNTPRARHHRPHQAVLFDPPQET